ncbi:hypothetical protein DIPPA_34811 [Diplonema papillatum]|nr:hypothetical protein DIPPA_34811 [Diplonema papillatum]
MAVQVRSQQVPATRVREGHETSEMAAHRQVADLQRLLARERTEKDRFRALAEHLRHELDARAACDGPYQHDAASALARARAEAAELAKEVARLKARATGRDRTDSAACRSLALATRQLKDTRAVVEKQSGALQHLRLENGGLRRDLKSLRKAEEQLALARRTASDLERQLSAYIAEDSARQETVQRCRVDRDRDSGVIRQLEDSAHRVVIDKESIAHQLRASLERLGRVEAERDESEAARKQAEAALRDSDEALLCANASLHASQVDHQRISDDLAHCQRVSAMLSDQYQTVLSNAVFLASSLRASLPQGSYPEARQTGEESLPTAINTVLTDLSRGVSCLLQASGIPVSLTRVLLQDPNQMTDPVDRTHDPKWDETSSVQDAERSA